MDEHVAPAPESAGGAADVAASHVAASLTAFVLSRWTMRQKARPV